MATFQAQVEALVGTVDATRLMDWLSAGARFILSMLPRGILSQFSSTVTVPSNGYDISDVIVLGASVSGAPARPMDDRAFYRASLAGSLYESSASDPAYCVKNGSLFVRGATTGGEGEVVAFPSILPSQTTIPNFPAWLEHAVVLFASLKEVLRRMVSFEPPSETALLSALPATVSAPSFTYTDASAVSAFSVTTGSLPSSPTFTAPTPPSLSVFPTLDVSSIALPASPTIEPISFLTIKDNTVVASTITAPSTTVPVFLRPTMGALSVIPSDIDINVLVTPPSELVLAPVVYSTASAVEPLLVTIAGLPTAPTFTKPTAPTIAVIPTLDLSGITLPSVITLSPLTFTTVIGEKAIATTVEGITSAPPVFIKPSMGVLPSLPSDIDIDASIPAPTELVLGGLTYSNASATSPSATAIGALGVPPVFTAPSLDLATPYSNLATALTVGTEDIELAQGIGSQVQTQLADYKAKIDAQLAKFNEANVAYQASIQTAIRKAEIDAQAATLTAQQTTSVDLQNKAKAFEAQVADRANAIQLYARNVEAYRTRVEAMITEYKTNVEKSVSARTIVLKQYETEMGSEAQRFTAEINLRQQVISENIEQARITLQEALTNAKTSADINATNAIKTFEASVADREKDLKKYSIDLNRYQQAVATAVAGHRANIEAVTSQQQMTLKLYEDAIAAERASQEVALVSYQATVQKNLQDAQLAVQRAHLISQQATSVDLQNKAKLFEAQVADRANAVQIYTKKLEQYRVQVETEITQYKTNVEKILSSRSMVLKQYETEIGSEAQRVNAEVGIRQQEITANIEQARIRLQESLANAKNVGDVFVLNSLKQMEASIASREIILKKFQTDLSRYQEQVNATVAAYRLNVESISAQQQASIKLHEDAIASSRATLEASIVAYQAGVQKVMQDAQAAVQKAQLDAKNATDVAIQNRVRQYESAVTLYKESLEKFQVEIARYQTESQHAVSNFKTNVELYGLETQAQTATFQVLMAQWNDILRTIIPAQEKK